MSIDGTTWTNELGSTVTFKQSGNQLGGNYTSAVGNASGPYALTGWIDTAPVSGSGTVIGFCVLWSNATSGNSHSETTWSGQILPYGTSSVMVTTWLLCAATVPDDYWASTNVGMDLFFPNSMSAADRDGARKYVFSLRSQR
jgi:hypothetical protein